MDSPAATLPNRFSAPGLPQLLLTIVGVWFLVRSVEGAGISAGDFIGGLPYMGSLLGDMLPPDISRLGQVSVALVETFQMAFAGTTLGVIISFPLAVLMSKNLSPHPLVYFLTRSLVSFMRSVPDLIWALVFIVAVGLGPFAGTLALTIDAAGFCSRFFAESMEEVPREPQEALAALGAGPLSRLFCAVLPAALPSLVNTSLYALEKATRASVVLGLVGAGGIGNELKVSMDMFNYAQAATIILAIFALVMIVEQTSTFIRGRIIGAGSEKVQ